MNNDTLPVCPLCGSSAHELIKGLSCACSNIHCPLNEPMEMWAWCRRPMESALSIQIEKNEQIIKDMGITITNYESKIGQVIDILEKIALMSITIILKDGTVINSGELAKNGLETLRN